MFYSNSEYRDRNILSGSVLNNFHTKDGKWTKAGFYFVRNFFTECIKLECFVTNKLTKNPPKTVFGISAINNKFTPGVISSSILYLNLYFVCKLVLFSLLHSRPRSRSRLLYYIDSKKRRVESLRQRRKLFLCFYVKNLLC